MKDLCMLYQGKMRIVRFALLLALIGAWNFPGAALADDYSKTIDFFKQSAAVKPFFQTAYGYVVFPTVGQGGLGVGGAHGEGQVYRDGQITGKATLTKGSVGLQAGYQQFSEIIFFQDKSSYDKFTQGNLEFAADASAVAITSSGQASAKADGEGASAGAGAGAGGSTYAVNYKDGAAVFVHGKKGLMVEASIGGQKFSFTPINQK